MDDCVITSDGECAKKNAREELSTHGHSNVLLVR